MSDEMDEIWALYADDGAQALDAMETALLALGDDPGAAETAGHVAALFRAVHTFKGNSRVLGLAVVESRAHLAEDLIGLVRDSGVPLDAEIRELLLLVADVLRDMLEETAQSRADVAPEATEHLMVQLRDKIARCTGAEPPAPEVSEPELLPESGPEPELMADLSGPAEYQRDDFDELPPEPELDDFDLPAPDPDPAPAADPVGSVRLVDDPTYRKIFLEMAEDTRARLQAALDPGAEGAFAAARKAADGLAHAARQIGLPRWADTIDTFLTRPEGDAEAIAALLLDLDDLHQADFGAAVAQGEESDFLNGVGAALTDLAALGADFSTDADHVARRSAVVDCIVSRAAAQGFVRVVEAAEALCAAADRHDYRERELRLYEELTAVENALGGDPRGGTGPRALLLSWCADHVFDTLSELSRLLETLRSGGARDADFNRFGALMRRVHHACQHYHIDTAAQLSMSLLDLFSRQQTRGGAPDPILDHIAQGFVSTIELVFDSLGDGEEVPQVEALQRLFAEATSVAFVAEGVVSAGAIERKLGLPREFHRVLSPESVRAAADALDAGLQFHVIRADINSDESLAESFLVWLADNGTRPITNVTVFRDADTLFDFLIATPLSEVAVTEALAALDPSGTRLSLTHSLTTPGAEGTEPATDEPAPAPAAPGISHEMLERIGEIATGQAMLHHMQTELAETDIAAQIDLRLRGAGLAAGPRAEVRAMLLAITDRQRDIVQVEAQLLSQMALLQEETVAMRSRPADSVLQPLAVLARTLARKAGREVAVTTIGGELSLDVGLLDSLRGILRALVTRRIDATPVPSRLSVALRRDEESVQVTIEDDNPAPLADAALATIEAAVTQAKGRLRQVQLPGGAGTRLHVVLPLAMVVIEGMVVGVDGVRYVLPVDAILTILQAQPGDTFSIAAHHGQQMLRLPSREVVPVRRIGGARGGGAVHVILASGGRQIALPVDEVLGQQLVLLQPLRGVLSRLHDLTGIALLAGGEVGMVISPAALGAAEAA